MPQYNITCNAHGAENIENPDSCHVPGNPLLNFSDKANERQRANRQNCDVQEFL